MSGKVAPVEATTIKAIENEVAVVVPTPKASNRKDKLLACFLTYLYLLLGVAQGMAVVIPLVFSSRNIPLAQQGIFSINRWAPTLKIFVAPIIDSVYSSKFGRRKSWIVGTMLFLGAFMLSLADYIQTRLELAANKTDMIIFTAFFFTVTFTVQCANVACDGLALSSLSKENKSWLATCRAVGINLGIVVGQNVFNLLESPKFCNEYLRPLFNLPNQTHGIVSLKMFLYIYGSMFLLTAIVVAIFKSEKKLAHKRMSTLETYKTIWRIVKIKPIQLLMIFLFSFKMGYAEKGVPILKIIRNGFSKDFVSLFIYTPLAPVNVIWPFVINKYTNGMNPLRVFFMAYPVRIAISIGFAVLVYFSQSFKEDDGFFPAWFTIALFGVLAFELIVHLSFEQSRSAFVASICDEKIGGTYIALLNTVADLGQNFPYTLSLFLIDSFSTLGCFPTATTWANVRNSTVNNTPGLRKNLYSNYTCNAEANIEECKRDGGVCETNFDSYYIWVLVFAAYGVFFIIFFKKRMDRLSKIPKSSFYLPEKKPKQPNVVYQVEGNAKPDDIVPTNNNEIEVNVAKTMLNVEVSYRVTTF